MQKFSSGLYIDECLNGKVNDSYKSISENKDNHTIIEETNIILSEIVTLLNEISTLLNKITYNK